MTGPIGRVLCVSTSMATRGGISSYVRMLADTPLWTRWQIEHVATHRDGSAAVKIGAFGAGLVHFGWALLRRRPDAVHLHMGAYGSFVRKAALVWLAAAARVPSVVHVHGSDFDFWHDRLPRPVQRFIRATLHRAAVVVALGDRWAERLLVIAPRAHGGDRAERGADAAGNRAAATRPHRSRRPLHVVFLGEIGERKGAFTLLETWAKLAAEPDVLAGARLTMAGDRGASGPQRLIEQLGIADSAQVRSWLAPDEVARAARRGRRLRAALAQRGPADRAAGGDGATACAWWPATSAASRRWSRTAGPACSCRPTTRTRSVPRCAAFCPMWTFAGGSARPPGSGCSTDSTSTWCGGASTPSTDR